MVVLSIDVNNRCGAVEALIQAATAIDRRDALPALGLVAGSSSSMACTSPLRQSLVEE